MIGKLRQRIPKLYAYSDKWIIIFLFARRHDLDETEQLITRFFSVMNEFKFNKAKHFPSIKREDIQHVIKWSTI